MARMRARGHAHSAEPGKETWSRAPFQEANFGKFIPMVRALSQQHRDHRIVIRPHPSESHDPWRRLAAELPNASVVYEGNVAEWLLAAELLIHNNCTTGWKPICSVERRSLTVHFVIALMIFFCPML